MRVLSLRGGGMRGLAVAQLIANIEARPEMKGQLFASKFDFFAGTSTGAILAIGLALGLPATEIVKFYVEDGPNIFKPRFLHRLGLLNSKYSGKALRTALDKCYGTVLFGSCKKKVMVCASDTKSGRARFFKSWTIDGALEVGDVAQASASAPTYFDPTVISGSTYEDGGLFANNPALYALIAAKDVIGLPVSLGLKQIKLLDISCPPATVKPDTGLGVFGFVPQSVGMMMDLGMNADEDGCRSLLGTNFMSITPPLGDAKSALDDASTANLAALKASGDAAAASTAMQVLRFLS